MLTYAPSRSRLNRVSTSLRTESSPFASPFRRFIARERSNARVHGAKSKRSVIRVDRILLHRACSPRVARASRSRDHGDGHTVRAEEVRLARARENASRSGV
ncbi:hypothetical protein BE221DRAFT_66867 [Ostreococcus tauri]|uniref:Uncharacterized protein n=1 Tax=Ostreococcus tauri TaxID=70448 RepID=A0A1Y5IIB6_OSTTA|nr:hypothetical protein BE221DRAFT_66867 [Ostreococcus tauri]